MELGEAEEEGGSHSSEFLHMAYVTNFFFCISLALTLVKTDSA